MKNELINLYENTYKDKVYEKRLEKYNETINKWKEYRQKIKDGTITLEDYTNRKNFKHYLTYFLEFDSADIGSSRCGNAFQYMIKMNDNGTFYLNKYDNEEEQKEADRETANIYFEEKIKPLLKKIVNCNSFKELYDLEKDDLYKKFVAKQIIKKMICLESKVKECEFKYRIAEIYEHLAIKRGCKLFEIENKGMSQIKQNINIMEKAFEILSLNINEITEKQSFEVSKTLSEMLFAKENKTADSENKNYIFEIISDALKDYNQIVLTGAPGTGKTYNVRSYVNDQIKTNNDRSEFVQFHPSYDYSDFIEGLRPAIIFNAANDKPTFVKQDGIFKAFCRKVIMNNFKELGDALPVSFKDFKDKYSDAEENNKFKTKYFFIIDEINRADLSKVFGELMFGLEESYRGIKNSFQTQYKNLRTYQTESDGKAHLLSFDCFEGGFFIPKNLYIIGTMNDIDKSVDVFDFALRRRFRWIEVNAKKICAQSLINMLKIDKEKAKDLANRICKMNDVISNEGAKFGLSEAYHIGHAYFKEYNSSTLQEIFNNDIALIIKEYTRGRNSEDVDKLIHKCADALKVSYEK
ncbi:McrB family protein [Mycoplasmopsis cynos]|uniref:AAA family ATPase n=2 Tax=Mycoplasmopsis cynos TaxID=171284 RepID=A0ABD8AJJ9_9BACT|nr:AAA family ATPase [Mycoplasmopsis cynos]MCU9935065.1 AAA family ATPase [Mycoplasmopsis cynos]WQQ20068.1 AAA family ATPase [Mycoplasmopsis cynos]